MSQTITKYTPQEELLNYLIHGLGIGLSIAGLVILAVFPLFTVMLGWLFLRSFSVPV